MTINGVNIGDKFLYRKKHTCIVSDIGIILSSINGKIIGYICYVQQVDGLAKNIFEVPFSTVKINKIN